MRQKCGPPPSPPPTYLQFVLAEKRGKAGKADGKGKHSRVKLVHKMQIRKQKVAAKVQLGNIVVGLLFFFVFSSWFSPFVSACFAVKAAHLHTYVHIFILFLSYYRLN